MVERREDVRVIISIMVLCNATVIVEYDNNSLE